MSFPFAGGLKYHVWVPLGRAIFKTGSFTNPTLVLGKWQQKGVQRTSGLCAKPPSCLGKESNQSERPGPRSQGHKAVSSWKLNRIRTGNCLLPYWRATVVGNHGPFKVSTVGVKFVWEYADMTLHESMHLFATINTSHASCLDKFCFGRCLLNFRKPWGKDSFCACHSLGAEFFWSVATILESGIHSV